MKSATAAVLLVALTSLTGCRNSCQLLCNDMADFAEQCGQEWTKDDVKDCIADHKRSDVERETRDTCSEYRGDIELEWTCEDLTPYFNDEGGDEAADSGA